jgi:hypothetical protein
MYAVSDAPERPEARFCRESADFELAAADWMRFLGFTDATVTPRGVDGGVDVLSELAIGQVKAHMNPIGAPEIQQLRGVVHDGRLPIFFSLAGYTRQALDFAEASKVALFRFSGYDGMVEPVNAQAMQLLSEAPEVWMRQEETRRLEAQQDEAALEVSRLKAASAAEAERVRREAFFELPIRRRMVEMAKDAARARMETAKNAAQAKRDGESARRKQRRAHERELAAIAAEAHQARAERLDWALRARRGEMKEASLPGADLSSMQLHGADFSKADFRAANLSHANLSGAYLVLANLSNAVMRGANLAKADLRGADLRGADLRDAELLRAKLEGALLDGAHMPNGRIESQ